jgi:hypothetical protein
MIAFWWKWPIAILFLDRRFFERWAIAFWWEMAIAFLVEDVACRLETEFLCTSLGIVAKVTQKPGFFCFGL